MDKLERMVRSWTPEQAFLVWELLSDLEQLVWDRHEAGILEIIIQKEERSAFNPPHDDLEDPLPFEAPLP